MPKVQGNGLGIDLAHHRGQLFSVVLALAPRGHAEPGRGAFLVNRLVQAQGSHIEVASQPGVGTTFSLYS